MGIPGLFRELKDVYQPPGDRPRRWFTNEYFDLILWFENEHRESLFGFQLCYDIAHDEHSLTWKRNEGFRHNTVDNGQTSRDIKKASILVPDGAFPYKVVLDRFLEGVPLDKAGERSLFVTVFDMIIEFTNARGVSLKN